MRVGLVLGAGGPLGWTFHLGVLQGVRDAIGREPSDADRIVGTSAGAGIAATLLSGTPTDEVVELITTPPSQEDRDDMRSLASDALRNPRRTLRPLAPGLVRNIGHVGAATALVGVLPAGLFPTLFIRRFAATQEWPPQLWVPSVRIDDGHVVVFGRDAIPATLGDAIEATAAMPGVFQPKDIAGSRYVDGAVASSTHADTLVPEALDIALVSAPMARPGGLLRSRARRDLDAEARELRRSGTKTLVITPDDAVLAAADGFPRRRPSAATDIVEAARRQTIEAFATRPHAGRSVRSGS